MKKQQHIKNENENEKHINIQKIQQYIKTSKTTDKHKNEKDKKTYKQHIKPN